MSATVSSAQGTSTAEAEVLARELQAMWKVINRTSSADFFRTVDELELSLTQLKALHLLGEDQEQSVKELGDALSLSLPAASRAVDGLVRRGLILRRECAEDRRQRQVKLSPAGADAVRRMSETRLAGLTEFVETLDEAERVALSRALAPIVARIGTSTRP